MATCPTRYVDYDAASLAATDRRISRALIGRRSGGSTTRIRFCRRCDGWHLVTVARKARQR